MKKRKRDQPILNFIQSRYSKHKKELSHSFHTYEGEKKEELKSEMDQEIRLFLEETLEK